MKIYAQAYKENANIDAKTIYLSVAVKYFFQIFIG